MIVTFYSFKGGVGRSMALANVAELLADYGHRVIICDWDLEAPGLERYVAATQQSGPVSYRNAARTDELVKHYTAQPGLIDLLRQYKEAMATPAVGDDAEVPPGHELRGGILLRRPSSYALAVEPTPEKQAKRGQRGSVRLLSAGKRDGKSFSEYARFLQGFSWSDFYDRWAGASYLEYFREDLEKEADIILIDSRTGVTEHGGVCTHHLADVVVLLTAPNYLNIEGSLWMAKVLRGVKRQRPLHVLPVASRVDVTGESQMLGEFRALFKEKFTDFVSESAVEGPEGKAQFLDDSQIIYKTIFSFVEQVVVSDAVPDQEVSKAYRTITHALERWQAKHAPGTFAVGPPSSDSNIRAPVYNREAARYMFRHCQGDEPSARQIVTGLASAGMAMWSELRPGVFRKDEPWTTQFREAVRSSELYLLLKTATTHPRWLEAELAFAQALYAENQRLRVVVLDAVHPSHAPMPERDGVSIIDAWQPAGADAQGHYRTLAAKIESCESPTSLQVLRPPGLRPLGEADAGFWRRDAELFEVLELLEQQPARRWLQIEGLPGSGKSSLIGAGLVPAVRRGWWRGVDPGVWVVNARLLLQPFDDLAGPLDRLLEVLTLRLSGASGIRLPSFVASHGVAEVGNQVLRSLASSEPLVIVIDQLERARCAMVGVDKLDELLDLLLCDPRVRLVTASSERLVSDLHYLPRLSRRLNTEAVRYLLRPLDIGGITAVLRAQLRAKNIVLTDAQLDKLATKLGSPEWSEHIGLALRALANGMNRVTAIEESTSGLQLFELLLDEKLALLPPNVARSARLLLQRLAQGESGVLRRRDALAGIPAGDAALSALGASAGSSDDALPELVQVVEDTSGSDAEPVLLLLNAAHIRAALVQRTGGGARAVPARRATPGTRRGVAAATAFGALLLLGAGAQQRNLQDSLTDADIKLSMTRASLKRALIGNASLGAVRDERLHQQAPTVAVSTAAPVNGTPSEREKKLQKALDQATYDLRDAQQASQRSDRELAQLKLELGKALDGTKLLNVQLANCKTDAPDSCCAARDQAQNELKRCVERLPVKRP